MKIGIIGKKNKDRVYELAAALQKWLTERSAKVYVEEGIARKMGLENAVSESMLPASVDVVVVLGGDGTFLSTSRLLHRHNIPIVGVNLGGLGFLAEFTEDEVYDIMGRILENDYEIEEREMISATVLKGGEEFDKYVVLNDLVINNGPVSRVVDLALYIDEIRVTTLKADGIILSTPTGSTAYSLSAGGPIVYPTLPVILVTPICPHLLTNRPLVVPSDMNIRVRVLTDTQNTYLTADGQVGVTVNAGDEVILKRSQCTVRLVKSPFRDYFTILKTKLMWGERYGNTDR